VSICLSVPHDVISKNSTQLQCCRCDWLVDHAALTVRHSQHMFHSSVQQAANTLVVGNQYSMLEAASGSSVFATEKSIVFK